MKPGDLFNGGLVICIIGKKGRYLKDLKLRHMHRRDLSGKQDDWADTADLLMSELIKDYYRDAAIYGMPNPFFDLMKAKP